MLSIGKDSDGFATIKDHTTSYSAWLQYSLMADGPVLKEYQAWGTKVTLLNQKSNIMTSIKRELSLALKSMLGESPQFSSKMTEASSLIIGTLDQAEVAQKLKVIDTTSLNNEGFVIQAFDEGSRLFVTAKTEKGLLYGTFHLLRLMQLGKSLNSIQLIENPKNQLRMINHWDNMDGSIERGYAGQSIFFHDNEVTTEYERIRDYARLLASVGINGVSINNVNVHKEESYLITNKWLPRVAKIADVFRSYGITLYLSINYASPIELGDLETADPLDERVRNWWKQAMENVYQAIPDFGGVVVKADSENRPGPFTYDRNHADGANMLAEVLEPFGGIVIWRCFVYNCHQDWRDRSTDRARAAYDHFKPLDGEFKANVILQIKNGPMDFQVREPVSPLFGAMKATNQMLEFQITQEYTGQQRHVCYLVPQWKECLDFDTYAKGEGTPVKRIVDGSVFPYKYSGIVAVSNIGDDYNWNGHTLAQANFYGYGRLTWNPDLKAEAITDEWITQTLGMDSLVHEAVSQILLHSWETYENYTSPLGVGWMVQRNHHYGPGVDDYEYSMWGTYHFADWQGIGVDRTVETGTGYSSQYFKENAEMYNSPETCPDELILFFHHVPYTHQLHSGKTVIQHIYDTHFKGVEEAENFRDNWMKLEGRVDEERYQDILARLEEQARHSKEWRDIINTYFYRKSGIPDEKGRLIY